MTALYRQLMKVIALILLLIGAFQCAVQHHKPAAEKASSENSNIVTIYITNRIQNHFITMKLQDSQTISHLHDIVSQMVEVLTCVNFIFVQIQLPKNSFELMFNGSKLNPSSDQTIKSFGQANSQVIFLNKIPAPKFNDDFKLKKFQSFDSLHSLEKAPKSKLSGHKGTQSCSNLPELPPIRDNYKKLPLSSRQASEDTLERKQA